MKTTVYVKEVAFRTNGSATAEEFEKANKTISEAIRLAAMSTTYRTPNEVFYEGRSDSDAI